jgi:hypothetical protein
MKSPMKTNKRLMFIAIPLLIVLSIWAAYEYVFLEVTADLTTVQEEQDVKMMTLSKYINLIARKADFEKQLAEKRELAKASSTRFIEGEPISIASANLQGLVKGIVSGRGGILTSERIGKPAPLEKEKTDTAASAPSAPAAPLAPLGKKTGLKKKSPADETSRIQVISVSIDATVPDIAALNDILYSIETNTPELAIKDLDIRVRNFRDPRELLVRIEVMGLYEGK